MTCIDCSHMFVYDHNVDKICNCFKNGCCRVDIRHPRKDLHGSSMG
nr:MAG TPA: hypothetical protein [Caudoviricetes sp.]